MFRIFISFIFAFLNYCGLPVVRALITRSCFSKCFVWEASKYTVYQERNKILKQYIVQFIAIVTG